MATENKRLQTRLMLKYDTYANWTTNNPILLKGEVAIATVDAESTTHVTGFQNIPNVVMKVGDGSTPYNGLKFVSGLAADVHSWAKAADKPSYSVSEIVGAKEYQVVKGADVYTWKLQSRKAGSSEAWVDVENGTINLAEISTRIKEVEDDVANHETRLAAAEGTIGDSSKGLVKDVADLKALMGEDGEGSVADKITDAINSLNSTKTQTAGADGLALEVKQENGVITSISGSIAAETYDAHGSAAAVEGKLTEYKTSNDAAVKAAADAAAAAQKAADDEKTAREAAINGLDFAGVEGAQTGTEIKFVNKVSQSNGVVSAELGTLAFQTAVSAENKAATMADVTGAVADLNGAMHFEGFTSTDPATGITIDGKPDYVAAAGDVVIYNTVEYVYDGSKWQKLGEEGALGAAIEALDATVSIDDKDNTNPLNITIVETNGVLTSVTGSIDDVFDAKGTAQGLIDGLDATESQAAGADGLALSITQTDGVITSISGSIAANTYDAYGAADDALKTLNLNEVAGTQTGTEIKFINKVSQTNGAVSAELGSILVNTAYGADNKIATMADITAAEGEVGKDVEALEKRVKANEDAITTLNGADTVADSVANKIKTAIEGLDKADTAVAGQFVTAVSEDNGVITVSRGAVNVKDLEQTADTYVVFDCGTSSTNI